MKQTIRNFAAQQFFALIILFSLSLLIWIFSSFLVIGNHYPFSQPEKRLYLISLVWIAWVLKLLFFMPKNPVQPLQTTSTPADKEKITVLQKRFEGAVRFLKKTIINKQNKNVSLAQLPWYLMIGPHGAGKTSLLAHANINFILTKQFKQEKIQTSDNCDWWVTRDLVLVDVPGSYLSAKASSIWNNLLALLKKSHNNPLTTVIIALPLPELIKNPQHKKPLLHQIKQKVTQLQAQFNHQLNFYFVITKCDLLPGFIEFFSESSTDELGQPWGITLPTLKEHGKLLSVFTYRFNGLIQRLNKQLIWRLHQERSTHTRSQVKDFPLQLERIKESITDFLKILNNESFHLHGIYLTSATQSPAEESSTQPQIINPNAQQALQLLRNPAMPSKAFFIRQLLLQGLLSNADHHAPALPQNNIWRQRLAYAIAVSTVIVTAILLGRDFQHSVLQTYAIQNNLIQYQLTIQQPNERGEHLTRVLPLLNTLQETAMPTHTHLSQLANLFSFYSNKSQKTAWIVYQKSLQTIVLPEMKSYFEKYLQTANEKNTVQLYAVLKAYLMLGDKTQSQPEFLAKTLNQLMSNSLSQPASENFASHIAAALRQKTQMTLNQKLIAEVRQQLTSLPKEELALVILKNMADNNADDMLNLGTHLGNPSVFVSKDIIHQIPSMFTAKAFHNVATQDIPTASKEALEGNAIIGLADMLTNEATMNALAEQLRTRYIENYVDIWESLLANLKLITPTDLTQMDAMIINLTSNTSPLLQILQTIKENTAFDPILSASPKFQSLTDLLANANNHEENKLYQIFVSLHELHTYLQTILSAAHPDKAAFEAAKSRMQPGETDPIAQLRLLAEQDSEPMKSWLNNLATQSWGFILKDAERYIEDAWHINIISIFNSQLANHFPFNPSAAEEVNLQQFSDFMGHQGSLTNFYTYFLKPFANETGKEWQWRVVDSQKLSFTNTVLDQLQKISQLQHAFFPNGDNKLSVQFSLEPISLDKSMRSFHLNINGQQLAYHRAAPRELRTISWPGDSDLHDTTLNFVLPNNQLAGHTVKGEWGWFRLVNQATQATLSKKQVLLNFNVDGHTAKYMLFISGHVNPFMAGNFQEIKLPEQLGGKA